MTTSVVISTYNGLKYLEGQLLSIVNQTEQADEVLVFDDCSTDGTFEYVKSFIADKQLTNWSIKQNPENKGWEKNFWDGISCASGDLIFTCDQDDIWEAEKIRISKEYMKDSKIDLMVSNYWIFFEGGTKHLGHSNTKTSPSQITMGTTFFDVKYPGCVYCFRKTFYDEIRQYWKPGYPHDAMLWRYSILKGSLYCINEPLIRWRRHKNSAFTQESRLSKTLKKKIKWVQYADSFLDGMEEYSKAHDHVGQSSDLIGLMRRWLEARNEFLVNRNFLKGLGLIKDVKFYGAYKRYFGDWILIFADRRANRARK